jgi:hypothetical protein
VNLASSVRRVNLGLNLFKEEPAIYPFLHLAVPDITPWLSQSLPGQVVVGGGVSIRREESLPRFLHLLHFSWVFSVPLVGWGV